ncbi:MAG: DUF1501 domain-containing protein [Verrucomicrobiota bacterium]
MKTRRQFLQTGMMGMAASWTIPTFLNETILSMDLHAADSALQVTSGKDGPILVVLQMGGGNDGLNCVIPYADDAYYQARSSLAIPNQEVIRVNDYFGLSPQFEGLKQLYDDGDLALINGVGYPNPNRSHFRSMEIWHTASDSDKNESYGWLGRYFDHTCSGVDPTAGVNIGKQMPQAFLGKSPNGMTMSNPKQFALQQDPDDLIGGNAEMEMSGGSIQSLGSVSGQDFGNPLDYLERTNLDASLSSEDIQQITSKVKNSYTYPESALARDLKLIAQLAAGGLGSRVYYASQGGYDTHANQAGTHERLTLEFSQALHAFCQDLKQIGIFDRTLILCFSEFGRRVKQNASGGTDHGAAGPAYIAGGAIKPGLYGEYPSLTDLHRGDLKYNIDFRSLYSTILDNWMGLDSQQILKRKFPHLEFV